MIDFRSDARSPAWSVNGRVLFERSGRIVLAGANPGSDRVLTAGRNPEWHPSGRFFAFVNDGRIVFRDPDSGRIRDSFPATGARDLRFSLNGGSFAWMEGGGARIRTAGGVRSVAMPEGLAVTAVDDFSADGKELLVTARALHNLAHHTEIYACRIAQPACRALTDNPTQRQDFARVSPSGFRFAFASSETAWVPDAPIDYEADIWLASCAGAAKAQRMTWFGEPANPRYDPDRARVAAASWSKDGRWLLATITEGPKQNHSRLVKIEFPEPE